MTVANAKQHWVGPTQASAPQQGDMNGMIGLDRIRAVVLLGGATRPSELGRGIERSPLDLPGGSEHTLLDRWRQHVRRLVEVENFQCALRVRIDPDSSRPSLPVGADNVRVEVDKSSFRGTAGVLRDMTEEFDGEDYLLVANAAQMLTEPLHELARELAEQNAEVSFFSHRDGTPTGLLLLRCDVLKDVSKTGYIDLKEQALPRIAESHLVRVVQKKHPTALPVRTRPNYIKALRWSHRQANGEQVNNPFAEDWQSSFSIVESGATVSDTARVHDSVVLSGGSVAPGAVLVRSVVCPGATVGRNQTVVDSVVSAVGRRNAEGK